MAALRTVMRRSRGRERAREPLDPAVLVVCFAVAATQSAWGVVVPVLPALAGDLDASATELGLVVTLFGVGRLVTNMPAGALSERIDPRALLVSGMAVVVVSQLLTAFAPGMTALLALRFVGGVGGGLAITAGMTLVAVLARDDQRGYTMSVLQTVQLSAGGIGPAMGGLVAVVWGNRAPFLVSGLFALAVIVVGWRRLFAVPRAELVGVDDGGEDDDPAAGRRVLRSRSFLSVCSVGFAVFLHRFAGMHSVIPLIGYTVVGISVAGMGLLLGLITLVNLCLIRTIGAISDRVGRKRAIVPGVMIAGLTMPVYAFTDHMAVFIAATVVVGVAVAISGPAPGAYIADITPRALRGRAVGVYRTWGDLAAVIGPVALGALIDLHDHRPAVLVIGAAMVGSAAAFGLLARETVTPRR